METSGMGLEPDGYGELVAMLKAERACDTPSGYSAECTVEVSHARSA